MKLRSLLLPGMVITAFAGAVAWLLLAAPPVPPQEVPAQSAAETPAPAQARSKALPPEDTQSVQQEAPLPAMIRDVSPEGVSAPKVTHELTRIEPSERYLELKNPPVEPIPDGPLEFIRVEVLDAGHLKSGRLTIKLANIIPLALNETCQTSTGTPWPCGARGRTFLRGLIRQLKITCEKQEELGPQKILATCKRGSIDLSSRLVRYGWAKPASGSADTLQDLAQQAEAEHAGQWKSEWYVGGAEVPEWAQDGSATLPDLEDLTPEIVDWSVGADPFSAVDTQTQELAAPSAETPVQ